MIKGLYEAHLPVSNIEKSIIFYEKLGLQLAIKYEQTAFLWIVKNESWLGLWECEKYKSPFHPSIRHVAFQVDFNDIKSAKIWLEERGVKIKGEFGFDATEPIVMPDQAHAMIYFNDPDGNSLEFISKLPADPENKADMYLSEWEKYKYGSNNK